MNTCYLICIVFFTIDFGSFITDMHIGNERSKIDSKENNTDQITRIHN